jgi:CrcB protein
MSAFVAVGLGAVFGAWLRWGLGLWLNPVLTTLPLGTLVANLSGGYLIGLAMAFFAQHPGLSSEWRLFAITGFLGALTTFSTFSAEVFSLISRGQIGWGILVSSAHLFGSLVMTGLGVWSYMWLRG